MFLLKCYAHILSLLLKAICIFCFIACHSETCYWSNNYADVSGSWTVLPSIDTDPSGNAMKWSSCQTHCQQTSGCNFWVLDEDTGDCYAFPDTWDTSLLYPGAEYHTGLVDCNLRKLCINFNVKCLKKNRSIIFHLYLY